MHHQPTCGETHERLLITIAALARTRARALLSPDQADDIAQDVVLECLLKLREGSVIDQRSLGGLVRQMVRRRVSDLHRRTLRRAERTRGICGRSWQTCTHGCTQTSNSRRDNWTRCAPRSLTGFRRDAGERSSWFAKSSWPMRPRPAGWACRAPPSRVTWSRRSAGFVDSCRSAESPFHRQTRVAQAPKRSDERGRCGDDPLDSATSDRGRQRRRRDE